MANNITSISDYSPTGSDLFLFDNNIWIYLLCPLSNYDQQQQKKYSKFLQNILTVKSTIFTTSLILSEFVNRCLRFDYNQWKKHPANISYGNDFKKNFVGSESYKSSVEAISENVLKILSLSDKYPDDFSSIRIDSILQHLPKIDFNDAYLIQIAKSHGFKIITHDYDFFNPSFDLNIITGNSKR